jgi:hypothetical protein
VPTNLKFVSLVRRRYIENATNPPEVEDGVVKTRASETNQRKGLYRPDLEAALVLPMRRDALAARVESCVSRAFHAIGSSSETQEIIYWNLLMTKNVRRNEVLDKPEEFIEGLRAIYGEAGTVVFEHLLRREIGREFALTSTLELEAIKARSSSDLLHLIAHAALGSKGDPKA